MQRTHISLPDDERRLLDAESRRTGRSMSSLIRDAVTAVSGERPDRIAHVAAMDAAFGAWRDRPFDGAEWVESLRSVLGALV